MTTLLTADDFAARLKCSRRHLTKLERDQRIPAPLKLGTTDRRMKRWDAATVEQWLAAGCPSCADQSR